MALRLVKDLLDVMSLELGLKPRYDVVTLHTFLSELADDYGFQAKEKGITLHYQNSVPKWKVLADDDRLRQLFQNLFSNALKYTESGKNIFLTVDAFQGRRRTDPPYPMILVNLRDQGPGMAKEGLDKIFDKFTQLKSQNRAEGRGLGLSVAKQISQLHNGNVWAESVLGTGSTFHVLLPHVISHIDERPRSFPASSPKVLVVEPVESKQVQYVSVLRDLGYETFFARDGVEAVTLTYHWQPDIVILTQGLSKLGEPGVANIVKSDRATAGIRVFLAGVEKKDIGDHMLIDGVLPFPFTKEAFQGTMEALEKNTADAA